MVVSTTCPTHAEGLLAINTIERHLLVICNCHISEVLRRWRCLSRASCWCKQSLGPALHMRTRNALSQLLPLLLESSTTMRHPLQDGNHLWRVTIPEDEICLVKCASVLCERGSKSCARIRHNVLPSIGPPRAARCYPNHQQREGTAKRVSLRTFVRRLGNQTALRGGQARVARVPWPPSCRNCSCWRHGDAPPPRRPSPKTM